MKIYIGNDVTLNYIVEDQYGTIIQMSNVVSATAKFVLNIPNSQTNTSQTNINNYSCSNRNKSEIPASVKITEDYLIVTMLAKHQFTVGVFDLVVNFKCTNDNVPGEYREYTSSVSDAIELIPATKYDGDIILNKYTGGGILKAVEDGRIIFTDLFSETQDIFKKVGTRLTNNEINQLKFLITCLDGKHTFFIKRKLITGIEHFPLTFDVKLNGDKVLQFEIYNLDGIKTPITILIDNTNTVYSITYNDNKQYDISVYSGLGKVVLMKNIINNTNVLTQGVFNYANTVYIIQYDYDLNGNTVNIPYNCTLQFDGGSIKNGTIISDNTEFIFNTGHLYTSVQLQGNIKNKSISPKWFNGAGYSLDESINLESANGAVLKNGVKSSTHEIQACVNTITTTNIKTIEFDALYYSESPIQITYTPVKFNRLTIKGNTAQAGIIFGINNADVYGLKITGISDEDIVYNLQINNLTLYSVNKSDSYNSIKGLLYINRAINSRIENCFIDGGYSRITEGLLVLDAIKHNSYNCEITGNVLQRTNSHLDELNNPGTGSGIYYKSNDFAFFLQYIAYNRCQALSGTGIFNVQHVYESFGGFGGSIICNELEGNDAGAIALSSCSEVYVANNYYEGEIKKRAYSNCPISPFIFGIEPGEKYACSINNLYFICNSVSITTGTCQEGIVVSGTKYAFLSNVCIKNNTFNKTNDKIDCLTNLKHCGNVEITDNLYYSNKEYIPIKEVPVIWDIDETKTTQLVYRDNNISFTFNPYSPFVLTKKGKKSTYTSLNTNTGVVSSTGISTIPNYAYSAVPSITGIKDQFVVNDYIETTSNTGFTAHRCIKSGALHYKTTGTITKDSNKITNCTSIWDWSVGDKITNDEFPQNTSVIAVDSNAKTLTMSNPATVTINHSYIVDAVVLPSIPYYSTAELPKLTNKDAGYWVYNTSINLPVWWNGSSWTTSSGQPL